MKSSFRYHDGPQNGSVTLFLFITPDNQPRATVRPPSGDDLAFSEAAADSEAPLPLAKAFALAVRIANRNDVEIVVNGDPALWDADWGLLVNGRPERQHGPGQTVDHA
tara:strand:- start:2273 stop:2596 length:324 start_codon:yes stop_codon:yes gene_type:complete